MIGRDDIKQNIEFDFFAENKKDFYSKFSIKSVLVQGEHWEKTPMVTIIIPTYKRPGLLKQALESALNQVDFEDYQILVVDNEGVPLEIETETSKLIAGYLDTKIVYYRHEQSVNFKMDYAVRLAKSPWIVFLHDDDLLRENHLSVLTRIVKKHKEIKYLSCPAGNFYDEISDVQFLKLIHRHKASYKIAKYPGHYTCTGFYPGWLGALINRKCYISTGGMPTVSNNIGDYCMVGKFANRYGVYQCTSTNALYLYRGWSGQATSTGTEVWTKAYANEYKYHKYVAYKYHKFFRDFWDRVGAYQVIDKCRRYNNGYYAGSIDISKVIELGKLPQDILSKGKRYERDMLWLSIYEYIVTGKGNAEWKELSEKHLSMFLLMNQWVRVLQSGKSIGSYLESKKYKSVAIYGMSYIGETLYNELQRSRVEVKYGIDRNAGISFGECKVYNLNSQLEYVDAVIVTPVYYFNEIRRELSRKMSCPIISIKEILGDLLA